MREKSLALSKEAERIILDTTKDRLVDIALRVDNADDYARVASEKLSHFYENLVFSSLDLGVRSGKALDLGTQFGLCAISLAKQDFDFDITCFQDSRRFMNTGKKFAEKDMVEEKIRWALGKQESLPFADHSFDLVVSGFDMHHWENPVQVLNEIERVTKANGVILIGDLRRDAFGAMIPFVKTITHLLKKDMVYSELKHSFMASYKKSEAEALVKCAGLQDCGVTSDLQFIYIKRARPEKKHIKVEISQ
ncbi:MAG: class I SAM-dependent methyltransferase [Candidatus Aenigmarchaeota archaeon]|nr:class I SAM-dependent methyltransferase [Candidatus Aenigmarchaeota archaeon]